MSDIDELEIRRVQLSDLEELKVFFIHAYGASTVFQDEMFLKHYFNFHFDSERVLSHSLIGVTKKGLIVSHYGILKYHLKMKNKLVSLNWGVNAYTLPDYRGKGFNSRTLEIISSDNSINGVIGFSDKTAMFYENLGYHMFGFKKFVRYAFILDYEKTSEICNYLDQKSDSFLNYEFDLKPGSIDRNPGTVVSLTLANIQNYQINFNKDFSQIATTHRTIEFLIWRFLLNPYIEYSLYGFVRDGELLAYIALREEILDPFPYRVNRIIDLYGDVAAIGSLLSKAIEASVAKKHIYIDFSVFGSIYDSVLRSSNFVYLDGDQYLALPQVTFPIEDRPNNEYVGILANSRCEGVDELSFENVYFTRMDSDRDRLAKIEQIK